MTYTDEYEVVEYDPFTVEPSMAICSECGSQLQLRIWGEGIDSSIWCPGDNCDEEDIYR